MLRKVIIRNKKTSLTHKMSESIMSVCSLKSVTQVLFTVHDNKLTEQTYVIQFITDTLRVHLTEIFSKG